MAFVRCPVLVFVSVIAIFNCQSAIAHDMPGLAEERRVLDEPKRKQLDARERLRRLNAQRAASGPRDEQLEAVIQTALRWKRASVTVCFLEEAGEARSRVARIAQRWTEGTGVHLDFGQSGLTRTCDVQRPSDIRVSFRGKGHWSYVGTTAQSIDASKATMNLENMDIADLDAPYSVFVVLHEFGHALGFEHEHQSPAEGCDAEFDWDWILTKMGWESEAIARQNMARLDESSRKNGLLATAFDRDSVMLYSLDRAAFKSPESAKCYVARVATAPSATDRSAMRYLYPPDAAATPSIDFLPSSAASGPGAAASKP